MSSSTETGGGLPLASGNRLVHAVEHVAADVHHVLPRAFDRRFALTHFWIPVLVLAVATWVLMLNHADLWLADRIYAWEGHSWLLKHSVFADRIMHGLGHDLSIAAWLGVLVAWIAARRKASLKQWRRPLLYLLLAVLVATTTVAWIKAWSNMDCPWDLTRYGGSKPYVDLISLRPLGLSRGRCFPAGHASAGYAWMSLYFCFLLAKPQWRFRGLALGVGMGLLFGLDQQLRGAHFASHDIWAAGICWMASLGLYRLFRTDAPVPAPAETDASQVPVAVGETN
ncbi:phosphatase PAP2 family protein [Lysobacter fragariae]